MRTLPRRRVLGLLLAAPLAWRPAAPARAEVALDLDLLKRGWRARLARLLGAGGLPYVDVESSCDSTRLDVDTLAKAMDALGIGLMALSADLTGQQFEQGVRHDPLAARLLARYPDRFLPTGNGGVPPAWTKDPGGFLDAYETAVAAGGYLLLGEFEFRHYPSPRQVQRRATNRDITVPIDGPLGERVFTLAERSGLPVQLHYEVEDVLLPPLEAMLARHPRAKVIWCHVGQVRYLERATRYSPAYVEGLIRAHPNLWFDTAFGGPNSVYPPSGQRHARVWGSLGDLAKEWRDLFAAYPARFLAALDLGGDRVDRVREWDGGLRNFLARLPERTQHEVAYRSAWRLLFGEDF